MSFKSRITDSINLNKNENRIVFTPKVSTNVKYSSVKNATKDTISPEIKKTTNRTLNKVSP
ncbi:MAG TPA: hypothetical protein DCX27_20885 [Balneola sp.]|nr:hypothetical protein [Balneola sp.]